MSMSAEEIEQKRKHDQVMREFTDVENRIRHEESLKQQMITNGEEARRNLTRTKTNRSRMDDDLKELQDKLRRVKDEENQINNELLELEANIKESERQEALLIRRENEAKQAVMTYENSINGWKTKAQQLKRQMDLSR